MADLRAHLRKIEIASPPDLWAGIEARATEEEPRMDTNSISIAAFRTRGQEQRRRIAAGLVAAAVVTAIAVVAWRSFQAPITTLPPGGPTADWHRCVNEEVGYTMAYPNGWHTTDVFMGEQSPANACMWFSPTPFGPDGNVVAEGWGYPLEVAVRQTPLEEQLSRTVDPEVARVLMQDELIVDGNPAIRLEYETLVDVVGEPGLHYEYLIEVDAETTLIVHTTESRGIEGEYEEDRIVVDQAVGTFHFTTS
jgi:hypothetical protein